MIAWLMAIKCKNSKQLNILQTELFTIFDRFSKSCISLHFDDVEALPL